MTACRSSPVSGPTRAEGAAILVRSTTDGTPQAPPAARPSRTRPAARPGTAEAVARLRRRHPDLPSAEIARRLGVTDRTVRRHLAVTRTGTSQETSTATNAEATATPTDTDPAAVAAPVAA